MILSALLGALGNRLWGGSIAPRWVGTLVMSLALVIGITLPLWAIPVVVGLVFFFRVWSPRPWLRITEPGKVDWKAAMLRSTAILPLSVFLTYVTGAFIHIVLGVVAIPLIPTIYWVSDKINRQKSIEIAELLTGAVIGTL